MIRLDDLVAAVPELERRGPAHAGRYVRFCFDSRLVETGDLFVAVRTQRGDGHDFVADAWAHGAEAVLVDDASGVPDGCPALVVDDTVAAMERYGAHVVRAWAPRVVAVTGTVGKTGTKELIAEVLATRFTVFRTPGNFSGRFGLAVALGGLRPEHQVAVVEMATGHFGEIDAMCAMAPPEVGVVTAVDAAHLVALGDVDGVAREKASLVARLPADGLAVLNADDPRVAAMAGAGPAPAVTFGDGPGSGFRADGVALTASGTTFTCHHDGWEERVVVSFLGAHSTGAALAALAVGERFGIGRADAVAAVGRVDALPGRLRPLAGRAGSLLLDDSYNAAPRSVLAGLDTLAALPAGSRVAVLGDMAELGAAAEELHRAVGRTPPRRRASTPTGWPSRSRRRTPPPRSSPASAPTRWCWSRGARWRGWSGWSSSSWPRASTSRSCWSARTGPGSPSASSSRTGPPGWRSTCRRWPITSAGWPDGHRAPR